MHRLRLAQRTLVWRGERDQRLRAIVAGAIQLTVLQERAATAGVGVAHGFERRPRSTWARLASLFPVTAPFAMPGRVALGTAAWWEPWCAAGLTLTAIGGLVAVAGRVYTGAILHTGTTIKVRDAWTRAAATTGSALLAAEPTSTALAHAPTSAREQPVTTANSRINRSAIVTVVAALAVGAVVAVVLTDVILGIAAGAALFAIVRRILQAHTHE